MLYSCVQGWKWGYTQRSTWAQERSRRTIVPKDYVETKCWTFVGKIRVICRSFPGFCWSEASIKFRTSSLLHSADTTNYISHQAPRVSQLPRNDWWAQTPTYYVMMERRHPVKQPPVQAPPFGAIPTLTTYNISPYCTYSMCRKQPSFHEKHERSFH
jgi:hypothetical protein